MSILAIYAPHFSLRVASSDLHELEDVPLVLMRPQSHRPLVLDATEDALDAGIRLEMAMTEALALCPDVVAVSPDPSRENRIAEDILTRLEELSPSVEADPDESGCWYIDLRGLERHFESPGRAARAMLDAIPAFLRPSAALADSKFAARVAARMTPSGMVKVVHPTNTRSFLRGVSVGWLPLPPRTIHQMQRMGIHTLGDLAAMPGHKVVARFGKAGAQVWYLANGIDPRQVVARPDQERHVHTLPMPTPAISREMLLLGLRQLLSTMLAEHSLRDKRIREVRLLAAIEGSKSWERNLVLKEPYGRKRLIRAVALRLQDLELPGPIESLTVELSGISEQIGQQEVLPSLRARQDRSLGQAVRQLTHRFGSSPITKIVGVEPWSRIPEHRYALISYAA